MKCKNKGCGRISIHAPREGGDPEYIRWGYDFIDISIHAPREGGDPDLADSSHSRQISIHAPREGGDFSSFSLIPSQPTFQSTPPARGATPRMGVGVPDGGFPVSYTHLTLPTNREV